MEGFDSRVPEVIDLDSPRDGVPLVIETQSGLERCAAALAAGTGPAGVDAERASGFRYGQRAFLVQIRREGSGTWLIDPEPFDDLRIINDALRGVEWILHAASQDLPCLSELGMWPDKLFDTELAARLAGLPRVGLAAVIEQLLGFGLAKEHSAADWSTRPLPEPWLVTPPSTSRSSPSCARNSSNCSRPTASSTSPSRNSLPSSPPDWRRHRVDPWRKTSGLHQIRDRRQLAAVRELWLERDSLAQKRDVAPGRLIPDSALVAAAKAMPSTVPQLLGTKGFHGRAAQREAPGGCAASHSPGPGRTPPAAPPTNAPPPPRVWADRDPAAAERLSTARPLLQDKAEELNLPVENLLTPDYLRRVAWRPPAEISEAVAEELQRTLARARGRLNSSRR